MSYLGIKGTQAWDLFYCFAETKALWSQGLAARDFWKLYSIGWDFRHLNISKLAECFASASDGKRFAYAHCSSSDDICPAYAQLILNDGLKIGCESPKLSICENGLLVGWACAKIGYLLAENARKLVTCWLSMPKMQKLVIRWLSICENHFGSAMYGTNQKVCRLDTLLIFVLHFLS